MVRLFLYGLSWQQKIAVSRGTTCTSVSNLLYFVSGSGFSGLRNVLPVKYIPRSSKCLPGFPLMKLGLVPSYTPVSSLLNGFRSNFGRRGSQWWGWWENIVKCINRRCLLCAGAFFLWDKDRITNQEVTRCLKKYEQRLQYSNKVEERDIPTSSDTVSQNSHHVSEEQDARGVSESSGTLGEGEKLTCTENDPQNISSSSVSEVLDKSGPESTGKLGEPKNESMESGNVDLNKSNNRSTANTKDVAKNSKNRITKRRKKMEAQHSKTKRVSSKTTNSSQASSSGKSKQNRSHARKLQKSNFKTILPVKQPVLDEESIVCDAMKTETVSKEETLVRTMDNEKSISEEVKIRNPAVNQSTEQRDTREQLEEAEDPMAGWQLLSEQDNCTVYYKRHGCDGLYQYKVIGSYNDITARDFMDVQVNNEERKTWDLYALELKTIDRDVTTGSEIVHWVLKFPFPMTNREYVFVRRSWISSNDDAIVLINRSVEHPSVPQTRRYVRVKHYFSEMVIKPSTFVDELGFQFELTYFDDPGTCFPSSAVSWVTKSAMPDFLTKIHAAALRKGTYTQQQNKQVA